MPSTLVHVAFGAILGTALLGTAFDRRSMAIVLVVAAVPDLDAFAVVLFSGAHRTLLHTMVIPVALAGLLAVDTRWRGRFGLGGASALRSRYGARGVRVAWVGLAVYALAGVGLDLVMGGQFGGANVLWPLHDQVFRFDGHVIYSTTDGWRQTFVEFQSGGSGVEAGQRGTSEEVRIASPVDPGAEGAVGGASRERLFPVVAAGWQLWMVFTAVVVVAARARQARLPA